jgi:hypothetical protein
VVLCSSDQMCVMVDVKFSAQEQYHALGFAASAYERARGWPVLDSYGPLVSIWGGALSRKDPYEIENLARPATIPRARAAETEPKGKSYHLS